MDHNVLRLALAVFLRLSGPRTVRQVSSSRLIVRGDRLTVARHISHHRSHVEESSENNLFTKSGATHCPRGNEHGHILGVAIPFDRVCWRVDVALLDSPNGALYSRRPEPDCPRVPHARIVLFPFPASCTCEYWSDSRPLMCRLCDHVEFNQPAVQSNESLVSRLKLAFQSLRRLPRFYRPLAVRAILEVLST